MSKWCQIFQLHRNCILSRSVSVKVQIRSNKMAFEIDDKLFGMSANGRLAELKSLTSLSNVSLDATNQQGWTALMFAARNGHEDVVKLLIDKGVELDKKNHLGQTAYDIAAFWNHYGVLNLLKPSLKDNSPQEPVHYFTVRNLDRASEKRKDEEWLNKALSETSNTHVYVFVNTLPVLQVEKNHYTVKPFKPNELRDIVNIDERDESEIVFLGNQTDADKATKALFAVNINQEKYKKLEAAYSEESLYVPKRLRDAFVLDSKQAALTGLAHSVLEWHLNCLYCQVCGSRTRFSNAGYKRACSNDECLTVQEVKNSSYLRLDPTIIVAVVSPDRTRLLLAKGRKFIPNMWSCLAGFMEPGESIEDACRREVFEESGVTLGKVTYHSSQPWPFPTQLMIGLIGQAVSTEIIVDKSELADAKWFSRSEVVKMMTRNHPSGYTVPPHNAIAHHLIKAFLHDTSSKI